MLAVDECFYDCDQLPVAKHGPSFITGHLTAAHHQLKPRFVHGPELAIQIRIREPRSVLDKVLFPELPELKVHDRLHAFIRAYARICM